MQKRFVDIVNSHCLRRLGTLPDLVNPTGYNEKLTNYRFTGNACSGATLTHIDGAECPVTRTARTPERFKLGRVGFVLPLARP